MMNLDFDTSIFLSQYAKDFGSPGYMITHGFSEIGDKSFKSSLVFFAPFQAGGVITGGRTYVINECP